jgi:hypothetical protein
VKKLFCFLFRHKVVYVRKIGVASHLYKCMRCGYLFVGVEGHRGLLPWDFEWNMVEREYLLSQKKV